MANTFVMYQTGRICVSEKLGHFINVLAAEGLISTGPDEDGWMVLVSLVHGIGTVQHHSQPFGLIVRNYIGIVLSEFCHIPGAVAFQVGLVDHVKTELIAKPIDHGCIRVMTGTDGIDVVLLHGSQVLAKFCLRYASSCNGTELMAVHAFEYNSFAV